MAFVYIFAVFITDKKWQKVISKGLTFKNEIKLPKDSVVAGNFLHSDYVKLKDGSGEKTRRKLSMN